MGTPFDPRFGTLTTRETGAKIGRVCKNCGLHVSYRPGRIDGKWNIETETPERLGTFTWGEHRTIMLIKDLADVLVARFSGLSTRRVKIDGRLRLKGDTNLMELSTSARIEPHSRSTLQHTNTCETCGRSKTKILGVGPFKFERVKGEFRQLPVPREPGHGIYIDERELDGIGLFHCLGLTCTDAFRQLVVDFGATNVVFGQVGESIPATRKAAKRPED
jgi:hypothetical protein